jgi:DNA-directed RNA polymerase
MTVVQHENVIDAVEWDRLLARQEELEDNCMARGAKRFRSRLEKAAKKEQLSTFGAAKRLLTGGLDKLEVVIREFAEQPRKAGTQHVAVKWLRKLGEDQARATINQKNKTRKLKEKPLLDEDECEAILIDALNEGYAGAAYMTLKVILDGIEQRRTLHYVASCVADLIVDELRYRRFREVAPKLFEYKLNSFNTSSYAYMARSLDGSMKGLRCKECLEASRAMTLSEKRANACPHMQEQLRDLTISKSHHYLLGAKLVDLLIQSTGLVTVFTETTSRSGRKKNSARKQLLVEAEPETLEWLSKRNDLMESMTPVVLPMVIPPLQWAPGQAGGYRFALRNRFPLVRGASTEHRGTVGEAEMPVVYSALNAIQNTAWRVNARVYEVLEQIRENGGGIAGVPRQDLIEAPAKPHNIGGKDREAEFARVAWKRSAHKAREQNKLRVRDAVDYDRRLDIVRAVKDERAIFFPHTMDFRGRIYPVAHHFTPQGEDMSRGLLEFAGGKAIGVEGSTWLAIHGANCLGEWNEQKVSKLTLQERVELIDSLGPRIYETSKNPLADTWWALADDPVQFLAFILEWGAWCDAGNDFGFVSHLPVSIDGTCNGLQHFSAMFRDEIGGAAVNLIPADLPSDIYEVIAEHVKDTLQNDAGTNPLAATWLQSKLVKRKLTKRPTMTFGYGSKAYGFQQQLCEYVQGLGTSSEESKAMYEDIKKLFSVEGNDGEREAQIVQACGYMSQCIWKALIETVVAAYNGMSWMQQCARIIAKQGKAVEWTVPGTGFPVKQEYFVQKVTQIDTVIAGRLIKPAVYTPTPAIELHKQANAIAPNVVHSLDAAALQLTVTQAMQEGVEHFAAIHDSYGCLAGDMGVVARATRRCFVSLYREQDVVQSLWKSFQEQTTEELPEPPEPGSLDLAGVLGSDYFFS